MHIYSHRNNVRAKRVFLSLLWSLQGWKRTFDPRSQRRCCLASSLVSIPRTPDAFLSVHLSSATRPPCRTLSPQRIYDPPSLSSAANCYRTPWQDLAVELPQPPRVRVRQFPLSRSLSLSLCYSLSPLLSKCKIRLTEHKHLLLESEAAPFGAEIKLCCLHATMNNEAITSDRRATSLRAIHTSNPIGCCTCAKSLQKCIDLAHALFLCAEDSLRAN